jgi:hypothetical protein
VLSVRGELVLDLRTGKGCALELGAVPGDLHPGYACSVAGPCQCGWSTSAVTCREADTLICGVGPEVHHATATWLHIDLNGVLLRVTIETGLVALIGSRVVQTRRGQVEHRKSRLCLEQTQHEPGGNHRAGTDGLGIMRRPE